MSRLAMSELASLVDGELTGADVTFDGVSTDTRTLSSKQLFVALRGPNFDGHDYVATAFEKGAAGALVERAFNGNQPFVAVDDARLGFGRLARAWRGRCAARVVGLTGSNGKTTLKNMIAAILSQLGEVLATRGNFNNDIGVPITLCRLRREPFAVIEMGANHAGEIAYLTDLVRPDVAILNNAGRAHLEGFGSLEGVAHAKAEIIKGLGPDGVFVFNGDDRFAGLWRELAAGHHQRTFGVRTQADVKSPLDSYQVIWSDTRFEARFAVQCAAGETEISQPLVGEHNRMNALAAIAASLEVGADLSAATRGLAGIAPETGRLCPLVGRNDSRLIDDSYNANPDSVLAALQVLASAPGRRTMVLGDLAELGDTAVELHRDIGVHANEAGIDRLLTVGRLSAAAGDLFVGEHHHFDAQPQLLDYLADHISAEDSVLIKGSRSARLDKLVNSLRQSEVSC